MNPRPLRRPQGAFTLLELMLVALIIGILAALLLPALSTARVRSKQVQCLSQLKQMGVAYHLFAHDHASRFPFQVSTNAGGTLEFLQSGSVSRANSGSFFRHFQVLSNDLTTPTVLLCPADQERIQAQSFVGLRNENISYGLGLSAVYGNSDSILASDRNIDLAAGTDAAHWTQALHDGRGNLLMGDGHVEKADNRILRKITSGSAAKANLWLPVVVPPAAVGAAGSSGRGASGGGGGGSGDGDRGSGSGAGPSSGFAALQSFFQPQENPQNTPAAPVPSSTAPIAPIVAASAPAPAPAALAVAPTPRPTPLPVAMPSTNRLASEASSAQNQIPTTILSGQNVEPPTDLPQSTGKSERCWYCWVLVFVFGFVAALLLGIEIQRRRQERQRASLTGTQATASSPPGV